MKIGITGSYGFLGSKFVEFLESKDVSIHRFDRKRKDKTHEFTHFSLQEGVKPEDLEEVDVMVHFAYDFSAVTWEKVRETNIKGSEKLFDAAEKSDTDLIQISSLSAFEGCKSRYGGAKLILEDKALERGFTVVKPGLVFGENNGSVLGSLDGLVEDFPAVPVPWGGPYIHYLCHYNDLSRLLYSFCIDSPEYGRPVIAASSNGKSFSQILDILADKHSKNIVKIPVPPMASYYGLRAIEHTGLNPDIRSDSILGLINPIRDPDFELTDQTGVNFREFTVENME